MTAGAEPSDVLDRYLEAHAANSLEDVIALFEEEAWVEDPVDSPIHRGIEAIRDFYRTTHRNNGPMKIERVGPALTRGREIVCHVRAALDKIGSPPAMDVIYVIRLGRSGRIESLRAWF